MGYSVGHWEGDTLVVESAGFNDKTWLDNKGNRHSDKMHLVERYTRVGVTHFIFMTFAPYFADEMQGFAEEVIPRVRSAA